MQRASAAFGLLIFVVWLGVLAVGLAYVTVWATTRKRPQWRILSWLDDKPAGERTEPRPPAKSHSAEVIPFDRLVLERRRKRA
jgi:hypothetical protein